MYGSVQASFRYGITAPFRRPQRDPPPPQLENPQPHIQEIEDGDHLAGGDAPQHAQRHRVNDGRLQRNQVHQRRPNRLREEPAKVVVETQRTAGPPYSEDEMDAVLREAEQNPSAESDSENLQETPEDLEGESASSVAANTTQTQTKPTESDSSSSKTKPLKENEKLSQDKLSRDSGAPKPQPAGRRPLQTDVQVSSF